MIQMTYYYLIRSIIFVSLKASVVIVFHNEGRSVLLRTIHSVINRFNSKDSNHDLFLLSLIGSRHFHSTANAAIATIFVRTPSQFLEEVLLVDDFSDKEDLGEVRIIEKSPCYHSKTHKTRFFPGFEELHPDLPRSCPPGQKYEEGRSYQVSDRSKEL